MKNKKEKVIVSSAGWKKYNQKISDPGQSGYDHHSILTKMGKNLS